MRWFGKVRGQPWPIAIAAGSLIVVITLADLMGLIGNLYVKEITEEELQYAMELENWGGDLEIAVIDLSFHHRRLESSDLSQGELAEFERSYARLQEQMDRAEELDVRSSEAGRLDRFRGIAEDYYADFRPAADRRNSDPETFGRATERGAARLAELRRSAEEIRELGEHNTTEVLESVEQAESVERLLLLAVASGLVLALAALAYSALRLRRMVGELRELYAKEQAAEALAQASKEKTDFLADVSHELRTPLTVLRGNAEAGLETEDADSHAQIFEEIVRESERMQRMIEDLLFLARSDAGSLPLRLEPVPVGSFLSELARRAEVLARKHGASFKAMLTGEGQLRIDPSRIEQAVLALVDNAAKYSPEGERVTLSSKTRSGELCIEVEDRGPGIPEAELSQIFERFYRTGKMRRRRRGSGLGLSIAKTIAEAHGGRIEAASQVGEGTRMSLYLPLDVSLPSSVDRAEADRPGARAIDARRRPAGAGRVLVIEDDPGVASLLRRGLGSKGIEVTVAEDGSLGRELWASGDFDLVLLDVMLPGIDGISLCEELRAAGDTTPVILLTARDEEDAWERGMAAGATDYISKPFAYADLISRVRLLLSGSEARRSGHL